MGLLLSTMLYGCNSGTGSTLGYQAPVQQGNMLNSTTVAKLHTGMSQAEVEALLGHPVVIDPYHRSIWTYVYRRHEDGRLSQAHRLVAHFSADKRLSRIETDID